MRITVNGEQHSVEDGTSVAEVVANVGGAQETGRGVAVAVNGEVVPRGRWSEKRLVSQDRVEILRAVGGG